jgi:hypothetical protein
MSSLPARHQWCWTVPMPPRNIRNMKTRKAEGFQATLGITTQHICPAPRGLPLALGCSIPTHMPQQRGGSIITSGVCVSGKDEVRTVCVSGKDEVRTFGAWWGLEMFKTLSQIAIESALWDHQTPEFRSVKPYVIDVLKTSRTPK